MPPPPDEFVQPPPAAPSGRRRLAAAVALLAVVVAAAAGGRYRVTRPDYRLARGELAVRAGDARSAGGYADRLEASGHADHAHLLRGEALLAFDSPALALAEFNLIDPDSPLRLKAANLSGRCLLDLGETREALRVYQFVVAQRPDDADGHRGLAAVAYDLGQLGEAVGHLRRVAELDAADARPHRLVGLIYKDMAQDDAAEVAYREALRRGLPAEAEGDVRLELAEVLARQTKFADALDALAAGKPAWGSESERAAVQAECLRGLGRSREAADLLDGALARAPTATLYRLRGQAHQDAEQLPEALKCFERAAEAGPQDHQAQYLLGLSYSAAGRKAEAARCFARVEELKANLDRVTALTQEAMAKPWDAAVRTRLAALWDAMDKPKLAEMWRKAAASCGDAKP